LLSRPDNTIFDEMRNTDDFRLFADLRLAGIGLAGVVHATNPIDAIQRFVGRIELGVIPQVIDTVIFIRNGAVAKVLSLQMVVKVPSGMTEADLARPVVVVNDFETKKLEYELYSYGEETVVVPVRDSVKPASYQLAAKAIEQEIKKTAGECVVEMVSDQKCIIYVPKDSIARIIGKQGSNIEQTEKKLGISIDVQELKQEGPEKKPAAFEAQITKNAVQFFLDAKYRAKDVDIVVNGDYLLSAKVGKAGVIKIAKNNKIGRILVDSINNGEKVEILL
jgi:ATPase